MVWLGSRRLTDGRRGHGDSGRPSPHHVGVGRHPKHVALAASRPRRSRASAAAPDRRTAGRSCPPRRVQPCPVEFHPRRAGGTRRRRGPHTHTGTAAPSSAGDGDGEMGETDLIMGRDTPAASHSFLLSLSGMDGMERAEGHVWVWHETGLDGCGAGGAWRAEVRYSGPGPVYVRMRTVAIAANSRCHDAAIDLCVLV